MGAAQVLWNHHADSARASQSGDWEKYEVVNMALNAIAKQKGKGKHDVYCKKRKRDRTLRWKNARETLCLFEYSYRHMCACLTSSKSGCARPSPLALAVDRLEQHLLTRKVHALTLAGSPSAKPAPPPCNGGWSPPESVLWSCRARNLPGPGWVRSSFGPIPTPPLK